MLQESKGDKPQISFHSQKQEKLDKMFDISACTYKLPVYPCDDDAVKGKKENCQVQHIICMCPTSKKVPVEEREYLRDQRAKIEPKGSFQIRALICG
ncbi:Hypothetical predicted protein [Octopus vulgaris]|uniref:Uncharacterized protein n=1 Tax=Octopus vulgaris TaxID=6645 RepID=A0AA36AHG4_OCTVU|nr:Hypothetical predicted protein [Octopus vulgaris]